MENRQISPSSKRKSPLTPRLGIRLQAKCKVITSSFENENTTGPKNILRRLLKGSPKTKVTQEVPMAPVAAENPRKGKPVERRKKYPCPHCPRTMEFPYTLERHLKSHYADLPFKCAECDLCFVSLTHLEQHQEQTHFGQSKSKPFELELKEPTFSKDSGSHMCRFSFCKQSFSAVAALKLHEKSHIRNGHKLRGNNQNKTNSIFPCPDCGNRFVSKHNLDRHRVEACAYRHQKSSKTSTRNVKEEVLELENMFEMDMEEGQEFAEDEEGLPIISSPEAAMAIAAVTTPNGKSVPTLTTTKSYHYRVQCKYCPKRLFRTDISRHERIHLGIKPYICKGCGKAYSDKSAQVKHSRMCNKEYELDSENEKAKKPKRPRGRPPGKKKGKKNRHGKSYSCETCGEELSDQNKLNLHRKIHRAEAHGRIPCKICGMAFAQDRLFDRHMKATHPNVRNEDDDDEDLEDEEEDNYKAENMPILKMEVEEGLQEDLEIEEELSASGESMPILTPEVGSPRKGTVKANSTSKETVTSNVPTTKKGKKKRRREDLGGLRQPVYKQCIYCRKIFLRKNIARHIRIHTGEKPYHCAICDARFVDNRMLRKHSCEKYLSMQQVSDQTQGQWSDSTGVQSKEELDTIYHQDQLLSSDIMITQVQGNYAVTGGGGGNKEDNTFDCASCGLSFAEHSSYESHNCSDSFEDVQHDLIETPEEEPSVQVELFPSPNHEGRVDTSELLEQPNSNPNVRPCPHCHRMISRKHMARHVRLHTGERPFVCGKCGQKFIDRRAFRAHTSCVPVPRRNRNLPTYDADSMQRVTSLNKTYACGSCGGLFRDVTLCHAHQAACFSSRPEQGGGATKKFKCGQCEETFDLQRTLEIHEKTHCEKESYVVCSICRVPLANNLYLARHLRLLHPGHEIHYGDGDDGDSGVDVNIGQNSPPADAVATDDVEILLETNPGQEVTPAGMVTMTFQAADVEPENIIPLKSDPAPKFTFYSERVTTSTPVSISPEKVPIITKITASSLPVARTLTSSELPISLLQRYDPNMVVKATPVLKPQDPVQRLTATGVKMPVFVLRGNQGQSSISLVDKAPAPAPPAPVSKIVTIGNNVQIIPAQPAPTGRFTNKPRSICPHCKIVVPKNSLALHMLQHSGDLPYPCKFCPEKFLDKRRLLTHMISMHPHSNEKVPEDEVKANSSSNVHSVDQQIISPVIRSDPLECAICNAKFAQSRNRRKHEIKQHGYQEAPCETCGQLFESQEILLLHQKVHLLTGGNFYNCQFCPASFTQRGSLTKHGQMVHPERYNYKIPGNSGANRPSSSSPVKNGNNFESVDIPSSLPEWRLSNMQFIRQQAAEEDAANVDPFGDIATNDDEMDIMENDYQQELGYEMEDLIDPTSSQSGDQYQCTYCEKSFTGRLNLSRHLNRMHTGERIYKCHNCNKAFAERVQYVRHMKIHGDLSYSCDICEKRFNCTSNLARHRRTHLRIEGNAGFQAKFHQCPHCEKSFTSSTELKYHVRTHTGEKPCTCSYCGTSFSRPSNLKAHMKTHAMHLDYVEEEMEDGQDYSPDPDIEEITILT